jgi:hypothetical protein
VSQQERNTCAAGRGQRQRLERAAHAAQTARQPGSATHPHGVRRGSKEDDDTMFFLEMRRFLLFDACSQWLGSTTRDDHTAGHPIASADRLRAAAPRSARGAVPCSDALLPTSCSCLALPPPPRASRSRQRLGDRRLDLLGGAVSLDVNHLGAVVRNDLRWGRREKIARNAAPLSRMRQPGGH